jgi:hypothetical protein
MPYLKMCSCRAPFLRGHVRVRSPDEPPEREIWGKS